MCCTLFGMLPAAVPCIHESMACLGQTSSVAPPCSFVPPLAPLVCACAVSRWVQRSDGTRELQLECKTTINVLALHLAARCGVVGEGGGGDV